MEWGRAPHRARGPRPLLHLRNPSDRGLAAPLPQRAAAPVRGPVCAWPGRTPPVGAWWGEGRTERAEVPSLGVPWWGPLAQSLGPRRPLILKTRVYSFVSKAAVPCVFPEPVSDSRTGWEGDVGGGGSGEGSGPAPGCATIAALSQRPCPSSPSPPAQVPERGLWASWGILTTCARAHLRARIDPSPGFSPQRQGWEVGWEVEVGWGGAVWDQVPALLPGGPRRLRPGARSLAPPHLGLVGTDTHGAHSSVAPVAWCPGGAEGTPQAV